MVDKVSSYLMSGLSFAWTPLKEVMKEGKAGRGSDF